MRIWKLNISSSLGHVWEKVSLICERTKYRTIGMSETDKLKKFIRTGNFELLLFVKILLVLSKWTCYDFPNVKNNYYVLLKLSSIFFYLYFRCEKFPKIKFVEIHLHFTSEDFNSIIETRRV